jgi:hypothetical protein
MSEIPVRDRPRRLADWLNPTGDKKVHSLVDKVWRRRCRGWQRLPERQLYGELGLVRLIYLIPTLNLRRGRAFVKAGCGKTARPV